MAEDAVQQCVQHRDIIQFLAGF
jgi:hypothetical protein